MLSSDPPCRGHSTHLTFVPLKNAAVSLSCVAIKPGCSPRLLETSSQISSSTRTPASARAASSAPSGAHGAAAAGGRLSTVSTQTDQPVMRIKWRAPVSAS